MGNTELRKRPPITPAAAEAISTLIAKHLLDTGGRNRNCTYQSQGNQSQNCADGGHVA